jgi:N,N'-diacetyllegionaminate synthase
MKGILMKPKIIAEMGWNHMGDMDLAKDMITAAKDVGADYAKFQTWKVSRLKAGPWDTDGRKEIYKQAELSDDDHYVLKKHCESVGIEFLTSLFCAEDFDLVKSLCNDVKIPSPEADNMDMVRRCIESFDNVYISAGASEKEEYMQWSSYDNVVLMHCVSSYPCLLDNINLPKLFYIKNKTDRFGYSGHLQSTSDAMAALSLGACVVEKHFTLDNNLPGRDNKFALLPSHFSEICKFRDDLLLMQKDMGLGLQKCENEYRCFHKGRWG